ncbi:tRNA 4-thiouridine(8) synthase ThiI [bacterium]|nr:tRNA 4-thiouridine(8) synthase ThiI [bacterium]
MRAIGLLSGGLDSILAAEAIRRLGIETICVSFRSPFFDSDNARNAAAGLGFELLCLDITEEFMAMAPRPKYGYGKNMNPCIDCKALMFRRIGRLMEQMKADFLFSGEVLGQRPMSQNKQSLRNVARLSGYEDYILRPLSAKLLPPIRIQRDGIMPPDGLFDLSGRGRSRQLELAKEFGVNDYPAPAGGCMLTEPNFTRRLRRLLELRSTPSIQSIELLSVGRHVRLSPECTLIVGRNESENQRICDLAIPDEPLLYVIGHEGPTGLLFGKSDRDSLLKSASIVARYSDAPKDMTATVRIEGAGEQFDVDVSPMRPEKVRELLV